MGIEVRVSTYVLGWWMPSLLRCILSLFEPVSPEPVLHEPVPYEPVPYHDFQAVKCVQDQSMKLCHHPNDSISGKPVALRTSILS
jgi:hypothetical protein